MNHVCVAVGVLIMLEEIYNACKLLIPVGWIQAWNKLPGRDKQLTAKWRLIFAVQYAVRLQICPAVGCISAG